MTPALPSRPIEPPPSPWGFTRLLDHASDEDIIGVGADLDPGTLLAAYRAGVFPMGIDGLAAMGWWSPVERGVLDPAELRVSRSLARSARRMTVSVDADFAAVIAACGDPGRPGGWITEEIEAAYAALHRLGWAHSIEVWAEGELAGGLYGVSIGGLFAGESMFHKRTDASKVALMALVDVLASGPSLIDVQWRTDHLASLGVRAIDRADYRRRLPAILAASGPDWDRWRARRWGAGAP